MRFRRCERWKDKPLGLNSPRILAAFLIGTIAGSDRNVGANTLFR